MFGLIPYACIVIISGELCPHSVCIQTDAVNSVCLEFLLRHMLAYRCIRASAEPDEAGHPIAAPTSCTLMMPRNLTH